MKTLNQISWDRKIPLVTIRHRMERLGLVPVVRDGCDHLTAAQEKLVIIERKKGRPRKSEQKR